jgi:hypothetical protein
LTVAVRETAGGKANWSWRAHVAASVILLIVARLLVRHVRLSHWRATLGKITPTSDIVSTSAPSGRAPRAARLLASAVERGAELLPFDSKCLPRAAALQWLLRASRMPSHLVIAFHAAERDQEHGFHAWVEQDGHILIGACDRLQYRPAMVLVQG